MCRVQKQRGNEHAGWQTCPRQCWTSQTRVRLQSRLYWLGLEWLECAEHAGWRTRRRRCWTSETRPRLPGLQRSRRPRPAASAAAAWAACGGASASSPCLCTRTNAAPRRPKRRASSGHRATLDSARAETGGPGFCSSCACERELAGMHLQHCCGMVQTHDEHQHTCSILAAFAPMCSGHQCIVQLKYGCGTWRMR